MSGVRKGEKLFWKEGTKEVLFLRRKHLGRELSRAGSLILCGTTDVWGQVTPGHGDRSVYVGSLAAPLASTQ